MNVLRGFTDPGPNLGNPELTPKDDAWHHAEQSTGFPYIKL